MTQARERILAMLAELEQEHGVLPRFAHNLQGQTDRVLYSGPLYDHEELAAAIETFILGKWFASGDQVARFEREFCKVINARQAVMVNSGSSANLVMVGALKSFFGWKDGDEVLVSVVGFPTTVAGNWIKPKAALRCCQKSWRLSLIVHPWWLMAVSCVARMLSRPWPLAPIWSR